MAIDYNVFYSRRGAAYRREKVVSYSAYLLPIDTSTGRVAGNSRVWDDATCDVQRKVIEAIIEAGKKNGFGVRRLALLLAMAKLESGFNPDAAAGTTSACGLGQFISDTGDYYGLNKNNRFEIAPSIKALIAYFKYNETLAKKNRKPDCFVYKYHHDGPTEDYGGTTLAVEKFAPLADAYEKALTAGHALAILDPSGHPIADADIRVSQKGKSALLRTNEHGLSPSFLASPDSGPVTVAIRKADGVFKDLGELAIDKLESFWTLVAPKERVALKTHLHEPLGDNPPPTAYTHKVRAGETVSRIARDNETTYQQLCRLNGIDKPYLIHPGQILNLPRKGAKPATASISGKSANSPKTVSPALPGKPVVREHRDEQSRHPVAKVMAPQGGGIAAAIAYAMLHKFPKSQHFCLKHVKRALFVTKMIRTYCDIVPAKDFGPFLQQEGFVNLLETKPGMNIKTAPIGTIIIYRPVEKQEHDGKPIFGHIEIKTGDGFVSDFFTPHPTYLTNEITMISPVGPKVPVSYKVSGLWFKETV